jgi:hypothetical protein
VQEVHDVMVLPLVWLLGTEAARLWLAMVRSRAGAEVIAKAEGESEREEERVEEDFSTATTHDGIRLCPHGTAVTGITTRGVACVLAIGTSRLSGRCGLQVGSTPFHIFKVFQSFEHCNLNWCPSGCQKLPKFHRSTV